MPSNDARVEEESLLRALIRRSAIADHQRSLVEQQVQSMEEIASIVEQLAEDLNRLADQADLENEPGIAKQARELEKRALRHEQRIIQHATSVLTAHIQLHPEHESEWVQLLYSQLANVRVVLSELYTAVVESADATDDLRAAVDSNYKDLSDRLHRAEDNPHVAVSTFGTLVRFIELVLEVAVKFGGRVENIWRTQARPVILPLLH